MSVMTNAVPLNEPAEFDWFTTAILANGSQAIHLRPRERSKEPKIVYLDEQQSRLFMNALNEFAQDELIPYGRATQAIYRAFWTALNDP